VAELGMSGCGSLRVGGRGEFGRSMARFGLEILGGLGRHVGEWRGPSGRGATWRSLEAKFEALIRERFPDSFTQ
jgi:hypothetical protein